MLKIGICEDDEYTREELRDIVSHTLFQYTEMEFVYYEDGDEVVDAVMRDDLKIDLLLLDIHMKKRDGMETAAIIRKNNLDVDIIFMTISKEYVFEGYRYKAFAYCLKPFETSSIRDVLVQYMEEKKNISDCINVSVNGKIIKIPLNKVSYFESDKRKVIAHAVTEDYIFYSKLDEVEDALGDDKFFRCHQSYMVNRDMIDSMSRTEVVVKGIVIPISRKYYEMKRG